jgi:hypothetical protein
LPLALTAAVFKGPAPKGSVVISTFIAGNMLPFVENAGMMKNDLEVLGVATDDKGKAFSTDSRDRDLEHEARYREARDRHRAACHPIARARPGPLQPSRRRP